MNSDYYMQVLKKYLADGKLSKNEKNLFLDTL